MFNPDLSIFDDNMFNQLRAHLAGVSAPEGMEEINLTIGEPQMPAPSLIADVIASHSEAWQRYPKADGNQAFLDNVMHYIETRFGTNVAQMMAADKHIVPVVGTREPLHLLGQMVRNAKKDAIAYLPNPYYHAWRAGALGTDRGRGARAALRGGAGAGRTGVPEARRGTHVCPAPCAR